MLTPIPDATYVPDLDATRINGALIGMTGFAPLQRGPYGSVSVNDQFAMAGEDVLLAKTFRQIDDSVRCLIFRKETIAESSSTGTLSTMGSGYSASTASWNAAAWGNQVIAVNYLDATQSSTGGLFSALTGTPPKARYIAANLNFVMVADTDDGADQYSDQVWWCALQNPTDWVPSIATQAGNQRLLDAPGPIKALVAYRDLFIAFKENAIFVGEYVGPPFIFQWRMVSSRIGLAAPNGVVELDDKLYFVHASGFYEFDGTALRNIGLPVFQSVLNTFGFIGRQSIYDTEYPTVPLNHTGTDIGLLRAGADDIEGVVWFMCYTQVAQYNNRKWAYAFGYNARTQKWSALGNFADFGTNPQVWVATTTADMREFLGANAHVQARMWYVDNAVTTPFLRDMRYPAAWGDDLEGSVATAIQGTTDRSSSAVRVYSRCLSGSDAAPFEACTLYGYANEQRNVNTQSASCTLNAELDCFDGRLASKFKLAYLVGTRNKWCLLAGVGIEYPPQSSR